MPQFFTTEDYLALIPPPNDIQPKFRQWVAAVTQPFVDTQALIQVMQGDFDIETAVGRQLDILGDILGRSRVVGFQPSGSFNNNKPYPVRIHYDQPGLDLTIAVSEGKRIYLIGWELIKNAAYNFTLKSGTDVLSTYNMGAYSGPRTPFHPVFVDIIHNTEEGEPLVMNCDVALPDFLVYVVEV